MCAMLSYSPPYGSLTCYVMTKQKKMSLRLSDRRRYGRWLVCVWLTGVFVVVACCVATGVAKGSRICDYFWFRFVSGIRESDPDLRRAYLIWFTHTSHYRYLLKSRFMRDDRLGWKPRKTRFNKRTLLSDFPSQIVKCTRRVISHFHFNIQCKLSGTISLRSGYNFIQTEVNNVILASGKIWLMC